MIVGLHQNKNVMQTFEDYEREAAKTAIYPGKGSGTGMALAYTALGLIGEAGEATEKIKKFIRDGNLDKRLVALELGDVLWYLTALANEVGYSLQDIAQMNYVKLSRRLEEGTLRGSGDTR